jgi:transcriptional regulator with XRE-family HTH domain
MKEFRKKEGISQMKLAEYCNTSPTYIGEIKKKKKFPSMDMIEKIAAILRIKPYHFFIDRTEQNIDIDTENAYPKLPR